MFKDSTLEFIRSTSASIPKEHYTVNWDGLLFPLKVQYDNMGWREEDKRGYTLMDGIYQASKRQNLNNKRAELIKAAQLAHKQYILDVQEKICCLRVVIPPDVWMQIASALIKLYPTHYLETAPADLTIKVPKCIVCGICSHCCGHSQYV